MIDLQLCQTELGGFIFFKTALFVRIQNNVAPLFAICNALARRSGFSAQLLEPVFS
jgi:hypothetical protein